MNDLDRVLDTLLHDVRSPLGVAGGYLRLMREQRLQDAEALDRAIGKTQDALRAITTLCADAAGWLTPLPDAEAATVETSAFAARVAESAGARGVTVDVSAVASGAVRLDAAGQTVADAVGSLLAALARATEGACSATTEGGTLQFRVDAPGRPPRDGAYVFDPWEFPGLAPALACRTILAAAGRVDGGPQASQVVRVSFPCEAKAPEGDDASGPGSDVR
ncbi:MAG: hypothetical protein R2745_08270 [Vicinamibacterales bacterium]